jgi:hypothetical protein
MQVTKFRCKFPLHLPLQQISMVLTLPVDFEVRRWIWLRFYPIVRKDIQAGLARQVFKEDGDAVVFVSGCERRGLGLRRVPWKVVVEMGPLTEKVEAVYQMLTV